MRRKDLSGLDDAENEEASTSVAVSIARDDGDEEAEEEEEEQEVEEAKSLIPERSNDNLESKAAAGLSAPSSISHSSAFEGKENISETLHRDNSFFLRNISWVAHHHSGAPTSSDLKSSSSNILWDESEDSMAKKGSCIRCVTLGISALYWLMRVAMMVMATVYFFALASQIDGCRAGTIDDLGITANLGGIFTCVYLINWPLTAAPPATRSSTTTTTTSECRSCIWLACRLFATIAITLVVTLCCILSSYAINWESSVRGGCERAEYDPDASPSSSSSFDSEALQEHVQLPVYCATTAVVIEALLLGADLLGLGPTFSEFAKG
mmetsp:Transcript_7056/g.10989  ORF Transcript_7056/g.10989 Transcript_7056/m.10989 type:complete len:324 (+) Transcript_7056:2127-3098(+)